MAESMAESTPLALSALNTDVIDVIVTHVQCIASLVRLRSVSKALSKLVSERLSSVGMRYRHAADFDENGVLYAIGTSFHRHEWSLTEILRRVRVITSEGEMSAEEPAEGHPFFLPDLEPAQIPVRFNNPVAFLLDRVPRRVFLQEGVGAFFAIDLGQFLKVRPTAFTLRHSSQQQRALRSFRVEACSDARVHWTGKKLELVSDGGWAVLSEHTNDERLPDNEHASATWQIPPRSLADCSHGPACYCSDSRGFRGRSHTADEAYRYIRVVKTGPDSSGSSVYFHLSGIELYGSLIVTF